MFLGKDILEQDLAETDDPDETKDGKKAKMGIVIWVILKICSLQHNYTLRQFFFFLIADADKFDNKDDKDADSGFEILRKNKCQLVYILHSLISWKIVIVYYW